MTLHQAYQRTKIPVSAYLKTGYSQSEIAKGIGKSKSTISQELKPILAEEDSVWEKGTNENNNNRLIRQYFPRGSDFSKSLSRILIL